MIDIHVSFQEPAEDANYQVAIQQIHTEIARLNQKMAEDREEIDRLKSETDLLKIETRAILATMGLVV